MHPLSERCKAKAKGSGQQCQNHVIGGGPCHMHGGAAPQVKAKREARILAGEAALAGKPYAQRDPGEALLAAANDADAILQRLKTQLRSAGQVEPAMLTALGDWIDRTSRISKIVLDARIDERQIEINEQLGEQVYNLIQTIGQSLLAKLVELLANQPGALAVLDAEYDRTFGRVAQRELGVLHDAEVSRAEAAASRTPVPALER